MVPLCIEAQIRDRAEQQPKRESLNEMEWAVPIRKRRDAGVEFERKRDGGAFAKWPYQSVAGPLVAPPGTFCHGRDPFVEEFEGTFFSAPHLIGAKTRSVASPKVGSRG